MTALQIKLLIGILAVLGVIAGLMVRGGRPAYVLTEKDRQTQRTIERKTAPSEKRYLVP